MYISRRCGRALNAFVGTMPVSMLYWTENIFRDEIFQIEVGIAPVRLLNIT
jgi:hypothetical protein